MLNYNGEREVIEPWLFYINATVTVNTYNVTPFCIFQIYVARMQLHVKLLVILIVPNKIFDCSVLPVTMVYVTGLLR
jgi:hypothetical protein